MRLFVGLELDDRARAAAAAARDALRRDLAAARLEPDTRWVVTANLHVTVWFIGEAADDGAASIEATLAPAFPLPAFTMNLGDFGAFPPSGPPRVFWIGVREGADAVTAIYAEVGARLSRLGFEAERRPYSPHLTIARVKDVSRRADVRPLRDLLRQAQYPVGPSRVEAVTLFRSRLSPKGAAYEPLIRVPLS